jgi:hypothetical protein
MSLKIGDTAPDFEIYTTEGPIKFMTGSAMAGQLSFPIRKISHRFAPPSLVTWPV